VLKGRKSTRAASQRKTADNLPSVFERFTEPARQVVVLAQDEARALKHNYIGTEHILLGLLREEEGLAARVLGSLGIALEDLRGQVARLVGQGDEARGAQIPFTPRGKRVLELSGKEACALGHDYIGTEHILLGIVRENEGVASRILLDLDADAEKIRTAVVGILSGEGGRPTPISTRRSDVLWLRPGPRGSVGSAIKRSAPPLRVGLLLVGAALGIGILIGRLIWG
jgi:hypothetical protein